MAPGSHDVFVTLHCIVSQTQSNSSRIGNEQEFGHWSSSDKAGCRVWINAARPLLLTISRPCVSLHRLYSQADSFQVVAKMPISCCKFAFYQFTNPHENFSLIFSAKPHNGGSLAHLGSCAFSLDKSLWIRECHALISQAWVMWRPLVPFHPNCVNRGGAGLFIPPRKIKVLLSQNEENGL